MKRQSKRRKLAPLASSLALLLMASMLRRNDSHRWLPGWPVYDMFAAPVADVTERGRNMVVLQLEGGRSISTAAHRLLPFEAVRGSSIVFESLVSAPGGLTDLYELSRNALARGWRAFDQVWEPAVQRDVRVVGMCLHRVRSNQIDQLSFRSHDACVYYHQFE